MNKRAEKTRERREKYMKEMSESFKEIDSRLQTDDGKRELADVVNTINSVSRAIRAVRKGEDLVLPGINDPKTTAERENSKGLDLSLSAKFEHSLILAGTGHGKTQLLSEMILKDVQGPNSVVVFDSQGDLIHKVMRLNLPRQSVVIIDPTDIEYPISLGLFDFKQSDGTAYERERRLNSVIELLSFVLNSLLDSQLTSKQDVALRYVIRLCMTIPDATILTLRDILAKDGILKYQEYVGKLSNTAQQFFREEFHTKQFAETREQIVRRVYSILENQTLERMFSSPKTRLDMGGLLDNGSVILINTAKSFLKEEGSAFLSRFMVALITQAVQERDPASDLTPTFIYIDESAPIIDENITNLLETARKYKTGITLAFQSLGQIPHDLQHSIIANTTIKCIGGVSAKDARALKEDVGVEDHAQLMNLPKFTFHVSVKGKQSHLHKVQPGVLDSFPKRSDLKQLIAENRAKYCVLKEEKRADRYIDSVEDIEAFNKKA